MPSAGEIRAGAAVLKYLGHAGNSSLLERSAKANEETAQNARSLA